MFKYGLGVELIGEDVDVNAVIDALNEALKDLTDTGILCRVKYN